MKASTEEATRLVLGTLVPVKDLRAVRTTIAEAFNVLNAMPVLGSLKEIPAPPWKSTRFVILSKSRPSVLRMTEVFPEAYVKKCIAGINTHRKSLSLDMQQTNSFGVKITAVGTIKEVDVKTMEEWHRCSRILEAMTETILWIRSCKFDRISLPTSFNDCVDVDLCAFTSELEEWNLGETSDSIFGPIERHELQWFIRDHRFQDSSFKIVIGYLVTLAENAFQKYIGVVNPMHAHISDLGAQRDLIASTDPFASENELMLMPMWKDSHWCAVVFNYRDWIIRIFDPMQVKNNYNVLEANLNELFPTIVRKFSYKRVLSPYQEGTDNCGLYCALFFECQVREIPMPDVRRTVAQYLRFRYLFKGCLGNLEWK
ncbi:hypothetical protein PF003_g30795 [Phytophthora fragariae]|nr:hypothetical protein PF003_g30795 [Phytophthora fragariae]